jgi:hypothetical protein
MQMCRSETPTLETLTDRLSSSLAMCNVLMGSIEFQIAINVVRNVRIMILQAALETVTRNHAQNLLICRVRKGGPVVGRL